MSVNEINLQLFLEWILGFQWSNRLCVNRQHNTSATLTYTGFSEIQIFLCIPNLSNVKTKLRLDSHLFEYIIISQTLKIFIRQFGPLVRKRNLYVLTTNMALEHRHAFWNIYTSHPTKYAPVIQKEMMKSKQKLDKFLFWLRHFFLDYFDSLLMEEWRGTSEVQTVIWALQWRHNERHGV